MSTSKTGRRKCRSACQPCRQRKRKCNGLDPCQSCVRYEYRCYFSSTADLEPQHLPSNAPDRHVSRVGDTLQSQPPRPVSEDHRSIPITLHEQQQRGRAAPFTKQTAGGPQDQYLKADSWNLGVRVDAALDKSIVDLVSYHDACRLAGVFFRTIHPVFRLIDQEALTRILEDRWSRRSARDYDVVISGVIALGSLFSGAGAHARECEICDIARRDLEARGDPPCGSSTHDTTRGWILRVLYLRMAFTPHSAWIASCSCIATTEDDGTNGATAAPFAVCCRSPGPSEIGSGRHVRQDHARLHWIARMLHTWIYQDYAVRSGVRPVRDLPCASPQPHDSNDLTPALISLYVLSDEWCYRMPNKTLSGLTASLQKLNSLELADHPVMQLFKSNHAFCLYRFMRLTGEVIPPSTLTLIIELTKPGLSAASWLAGDGQPWWHVVHLPFQFLCVMLCMDTRDSLQEVENATTVLRRVERSFSTKRMQSVIRTAEALVSMCRSNKLEAVSALSRSSGGAAQAGTEQPSEDTARLDPAPSAWKQSNTPVAEGLAPWAFGGDSHSGFSWDDFMNMEFPMNTA